MYNIDPKGTVTYNGVKVPTILDHKTSCKLGLGSNHGDVEHWFKKHGKTLDDVRNDVAKLLGEDTPATPVEVKTYEVVTDIPVYDNSSDARAQKNSIGTYKPGTYYIYNKYPDGYKGMLNISTDATGKLAGAWINPSENVVKETTAPEKETSTEQETVQNQTQDVVHETTDTDNATSLATLIFNCIKKLIHMLAEVFSK